MKKYFILILVLISLQGMSQSIKDNGTYYSKETRTLHTDTCDYIVLSQEKVAKNLYRIFMCKNGRYYDCVWSKKKFLLINEL